MFLERLNHSDQPAETQSPLASSAAASLVSFVLICCLDSRFVSMLRVWWAELLVYAVIPVLVAFIVLYRSSWHQEMRRAGRACLLALVSCSIFGAVLIAAGFGMVVALFVYFGCFDNFSRFH